MQSPFTIFRKNQKAAMAAMTLMAMFAFVFLDTFQRSFAPRNAAGGEVVVESNAGNLTRTQLSNLVYRRHRANKFVVDAIFASHPEYQQYPQQILQIFVGRQQFGFGRSSAEADVVFGYLLRQEAHRLGVAVDNAQIEEYIDSITDRKLSSTQFTELVRGMKLSSKELYDMLRDELQARITLQLTRPRDPQPPERLWKIYQKMNVRERIEVAAIPVNEFVGAVSDPSETELQKYFELHKSHFDEIEAGDLKPGFKQPRKVKLQYLQTRYLDAEASVLKTNPVNDKDVLAFYEANKDKLYRFNAIPPIDTKHEPITPEFTPEGTTGPAQPKLDAPDAGEKPAVPKEESKDPAAAKPSEDKAPPKGDAPPKADPAKDAKPEEKSPDAPQSKESQKESAKEPAKPSTDEAPNSEEKPKEDAKPEGTSQSRNDRRSSVYIAAANLPPAVLSAVFGSQNDDTVKDDAKQDVPKADSPKADASKEGIPAAKGDDSVKPAGEGKEADGKDAKKEVTPADAPGSKEKDGAKGDAPPAPKYKPLDDDLKAQIRDELVRERTLAKMKDLAHKAEGAMVDDIGLKLNNDFPNISSLSPDQAKDLEEQAKAGLQKIAAKRGLQYGETALVSAKELSDLPGIGKAREQSSDAEMFRGNVTTILMQIFGNDMLLSPVQSQEGDDLYIVWKVRDVSVHIPKFDDPGVRDQVLRAWKLKQAEPLAQERAKAVKELVEKSKKPMRDALKGETVTKAKSSMAITVQETPEFSWMRESTAPAMNPFGPRTPPQISEPVFIDKPGNEFMQVAFEQLSKPGDVAVAANFDKSILYVTKLVDRRSVSREAFLKTPLFGQGQTPYEQIAQYDEQMIFTRFDTELKQRYALKWREASIGEGEEESSDE